ncbi:MAG: serine hydrolase domain-containing protein [Tepidiformaceae bacterium]
MSKLIDVAARLEQEVPEMLAQHGIPGLAIGVVSESDGTWTGAFGTTRRAGTEPVTTRTIFSLQSCSKTYTATAIMLAVQSGLLDLDRPVTNYLQEFTVNSAFESAPERQITLRQMLSHTAGFTHEAPIGNNFVVGGSSFEAHCRSIPATWLRFPVGHHYEYSNLGIDLAAFALERGSGLTFEEYQRRHLLGPLGLVRTTFDQRRIARDGDRAAGHSHDAKRLPVRIPMVAAGGIYASIEDACRFIQFHLRRGEALLTPGLLDEMYTIPLKPLGQREGYGLGIADAGWFRGHSGGGFGFLSDMYWTKEAGVGAAILTNSDNHPLQGALSERILRDLAGPLAVPTPVGRPPTSASHEDVAEISARVAGRYVGRGSMLSVTFESGQLFLASSGTRRPLRLVARDEVMLDEPPFDSWRLLPDQTGRSRYLRALKDGQVWYRNDVGATPPSSMGEGWGGDYHIRRMGGRRTPVKLGMDDRGPFIKRDGEPKLRLERHLPGLFFSTMGEALDLRGERATYANVELVPALTGKL